MFYILTIKYNSQICITNKKIKIMNKYAIFVNGKLIKTFKTFKQAAQIFKNSVDFLKQTNQNDDVLIQVIGLGEGVLLEN